MKTVRRIAKNLISLFTSTITLSLLTFILSIFIARFLGDTAFGDYSFALSFTKLYFIFLDLGFETLLIREVARNKSLTNKYVSNILGLKLVLTPIILISIIITAILLEYSPYLQHVIYLLSLFLIISIFSSIFRVTFRAYEQMEYDAIIGVASIIIRFVLGIGILFLGYGLIELLIVYIIANLIELLLSILLFSKKIQLPKIAFDISFLKNKFSQAFPLGVLSIFGFIYVSIDTIMLSFFDGNTVVGWYRAAYNLVLAFGPIPHLFMHSLFPLLSTYYISSKKSLQNTYKRSFKYLFYLGLPLSIGIFFLSDKIIIYFYGYEFLNSIVALRILAWDALIIFLTTCASFVLISSNKQKQLGILVVVAATLNIVLNYLLIPIYSYVGSGIATIISELFLLISYLIVNYKNSFSPGLKKYIIQPLIASAFMSLFLYYSEPILLPLQIVLSIGIYFVVLFLVKGFSKEDIALVKSLIQK